MEFREQLTLERVEALILSLYEPNTPERIAATQATLARIQGTPQAWKLSKDLISRPDEKVQFFGVLTIIVKLNTENMSISDEEAIELLSCLIGWYIDIVRGSGSRLVTRKLVSALSTFFTRYHAIWQRFLDHIAACLVTSQACHPENLDKNTGVESILPMLSSQEIQALLWVATHVMEDITKLDPNSLNNASTYESMLLNIESIVKLLARCLESDCLPPAVLEDAVKCLQALVAFSQKAPSHEHDTAASVKPLIGKVIKFLAVDGVCEASAELITEALSNNQSLFTHEHYRLIDLLFKSPWATNSYRRITEGHLDFDSVQFVQLLLAFAETRMPLLIKTCHTESLEILYRICDLLLARGYPVVDDRIFVPVVEFWCSFAETVPDYLPAESGEPAPWKGSALSLLLHACSNAWQKITYPPSDEVADWDSNDRAGFSDARKDVVDLLQSVYALVGSPLLGTFVDTIASSLQESSWLRLEAAVYCLGGLADCCQEDGRCDTFLASVFHSPLFSILRNGRAMVPARTQQACLLLIELYTEYFERNPVLLPPALELLFSMLGDKVMAAAASKSILRLSSSCRWHLRTEIDAFLDEYIRVITQQQLDCTTSERTLGALSSVAQAMEDPSTRHVKYGQILEVIEADLQRCQRLGGIHGGNTAELLALTCPDTTPEENASLHAALKVLRCLVGVGKGLQAPYENAIDLEHDTVHALPESTNLPALQRRIVRMIIDVQKMFPTSNEITEQICNVLRTGFSETEPGPFVLPPAEVAQYLTSHTYSTPRVGLFISTACSFINSLRDKDDHQVIFSAVFAWSIQLMKQFPTSNNSHLNDGRTIQQSIDISAEPEVAQNAMEMAGRILIKAPAVIFQIQPPTMAEFFFFFTLQALDGNEPLPKAAAAEFWATFVNLRSSDEGLQSALSGVMGTLGPLLCQSLARNIGGNASRSELDKLSEPLKKLFSRNPRAKDWLEAALHHPSFPGTTLSQTDKAIFVKKLSSLRGSRVTNQVVREFWLAARGSSFSYAS